MAFTVTLFKKNGLLECTKFLGSDKNSEWSKLLADDDLKKAKVVFALVDINNIKAEAPLYAHKVHRCPYIDIRFEDTIDNSLAYPAQAPLVASEIKEWIFNYIKLVNDVQSSINNPEKRDGELQSEGTTATWVTPTILGGGLLVGAIVGGVMIIREREKNRYLDTEEFLNIYDQNNDNNDDVI